MYIICPTEHLEYRINQRFRDNNYFYASLGTSLSLDKDTIEQIIIILKKHCINEITIVLSDQNTIVNDALNNQDFISISGLKESYNQLIIDKMESSKIWSSTHQNTVLLSYYLNFKINELQKSLKSSCNLSCTINAKIYSYKEDKFYNIHSELVNINPIRLN